MLRGVPLISASRNVLQVVRLRISFVAVDVVDFFTCRALPKEGQRDEDMSKLEGSPAVERQADMVVPPFPPSLLQNPSPPAPTVRAHAIDAPDPPEARHLVPARIRGFPDLSHCNRLWLRLLGNGLPKEDRDFQFHLLVVPVVLGSARASSRRRMPHVGRERR